LDGRHARTNLARQDCGKARATRPGEGLTMNSDSLAARLVIFAAAAATFVLAYKGSAAP